ncbi:hypothetical protein [Glutamicibacter sp. PS]|uniref:hypothetical protein n=1 Tax=Glutamicibacter sp. PS TaxID=3075634 RepID=UPI00284BA977|nr:hypothetical protein [Glutamicibacter sp. PS]MDR4533203.1 hypothetical protein [Glutamicibacter sp. PS]
MADSSGDNPVTNEESDLEFLRSQLALAENVIGQYRQALADVQFQLVQLKAQAAITQPTA